jgi:hypothetical protein
MFFNPACGFAGTLTERTLKLFVAGNSICSPVTGLLPAKLIIPRFDLAGFAVFFANRTTALLATTGGVELILLLLVSIG